MKTIHVNAASKSYDVLLGQGLLSQVGKLATEAFGPKTKKICVVTDENVNSLYGGEDQSLMTSLREAGFEVCKHLFPGGEKHKNLQTIEDILDLLSEHRFSRKDGIVAFGGGITGDIAGFAASIYMRGIPFIQVPTTLLAAVDSSVGGKTGVNLKAGKNLAGAFWQPELVVFDMDVMSTLSRDRLLDGSAEIIKSGLIANKSIIEDMLALDSFENQGALAEIIAKTINVKRNIVEEDERESGRRQLLNLGHTIGHAIEKCSDYQISHGCAVAMGTGIVAKASDALGWTNEAVSPYINKIFQHFAYPEYPGFSAEALTEVALSDKKASGESITLVYPKTIGKSDLKTIPSGELLNFIQAGLDK